jgi:hypothetical protein
MATIGEPAQRANGPTGQRANGPTGQRAKPAQPIWLTFFVMGVNGQMLHFNIAICIFKDILGKSGMPFIS